MTEEMDECQYMKMEKERDMEREIWRERYRLAYAGFTT